jgi:tetratricopeptide (TPR) repeat protein
MTTTTFKGSCIVFNTATFQNQIRDLKEPYVNAFGKINRAWLFFHFFFIVAMSLELIIFGLLFSRFLQSTAMAFWLAGIFMTFFSYLVLLFYMQDRHPERLMQLRDNYLDAARSCIPFELGSLEYHCCITQAIFQFNASLQIPHLENQILLASEMFSYLTQKFRIWARWKDLLKLKEMLLLSSIGEHIRLIKKKPADLEAHASLASNYVALAKLYQDPKTLMMTDEIAWIPPDYKSEEMGEKFHMALERALEEYHIIDAYAPNDPWVHAQRASLYKELDRAEEEQKEYEIILNLDPENEEILLRLGKLYFRKGENAKGLKIYDQLQGIDQKKALSLISRYEAYSIEEYPFEY